MVNRVFITALLALGASLAQAQTSIQLHGLSKHSGTTRYNETNAGVGIRHQVSDDWSVQVGTYRNSYYKRTTYLAGNWTPVQLADGIKAGAFIGVGTGYPQLALGGFMATVRAGRLEWTVRAIPKAGRGTDAVVALEIGVQLP